ncbi:MAG: hypothetical protein FIB08_13900 [Candidatus Methanoperedens sp.]|nr:hypothetical protein [Candidatus Methanoperedens sp.]
MKGKEMNRQLEWYKYLVYNKSAFGSLFTLMHLPFMLAFLPLVITGTAAFRVVDRTVLGLSLVVVFLLLYGEHMLDDTTRAGKPWRTVFSDAALVSAGCFVFILALLTGIYAGRILGSLFPGAAVGTGILFCTLYGLEFQRFHTVEFGALGMAAIPVSSYYVQVLALGLEANPFVIIGLSAFGFGYGYVMLALYEHTKTQEYQISWKLLGLQLILIYALAGTLSLGRI